MSTMIQVVEGVTGGFVPAVPKRQVIIDLDGNHISITKYVKSNDTEAIDGYLQHTTGENLSRYFEIFIKQGNYLVCGRIIENYTIITNGGTKWL
jgi:hypothetical protein